MGVFVSLYLGYLPVYFKGCGILGTSSPIKAPVEDVGAVS